MGDVGFGLGLQGKDLFGKRAFKGALVHLGVDTHLVFDVGVFEAAVAEGDVVELQGHRVGGGGIGLPKVVVVGARAIALQLHQRRADVDAFQGVVAAHQVPNVEL